MTVTYTATAISKNPLDTVTLNGLNGYKDAISILNTKAQDFLNLEFVL